MGREKNLNKNTASLVFNKLKYKKMSFSFLEKKIIQNSNMAINKLYFYLSKKINIIIITYTFFLSVTISQRKKKINLK